MTPQTNGCNRKHLILLLAMIPTCSAASAAVVAAMTGGVRDAQAAVVKSMGEQETRLRQTESALAAGKAARESFERSVDDFRQETRETLRRIEGKIDRHTTGGGGGNVAASNGP